jgi:hypothetical protein
MTAHRRYDLLRLKTTANNPLADDIGTAGCSPTGMIRNRIAEPKGQAILTQGLFRATCFPFPMAASVSLEEGK